MSEQQDMLEVLGQRIHYPRSWQSTAGVIGVAFIVCVTAVAIVWIVLVVATESRVREVASIVLQMKTFDKGGTLQEAKRGKLVEFWSPSAQTCASIQASLGTVRADQQWQCIGTDDRVLKFGSELLTHFGDHVNGYRRWQVWGHGRTSEKVGWWWVLNVDSTFDTSEFVRYYSDYWNNVKPVYIEEVNGQQGFVADRSERSHSKGSD